MTQTARKHALAPIRTAMLLFAGTFVSALALPALASAEAGAPPAASGVVPPAAAVEQARAALDPNPGADPEESREVTLAMRDLALAVPELEGSKRSAAKQILARPTDNPDENRNSYKVPEATPFCSAHFCVHYVTSSGDAPSLADANTNGVPDYVEAISAAAETSFAVENGTLTWPAPKSDGTLGGGSGLTDIYLVDVGSDGIFGYAAPDGSQKCKRSCFAYLVLDNDFSPAEFGYPDPGIPLRVTMAHEYNHVLQFGIDTVQDAWLFESTATWSEENVFPADNDYINYLPKFAKTPGVPITEFQGGGGLRIYGLAVLQHWIDRGPGNFGPSVVLGSWLASTKTDPTDYAVGAMDRSIRDRGGKGFSAEFSEFAAATAEWQTAGNFPDAALYPDVKRKGSLKPGKRPQSFVLDHTTYRLFNVPASSKPQLKLKVRAEEKVQTGIALVARDDETGTVTSKVKLLKKGGKGSVTLTGPANFERITAAVVNADGRVKGFSSTERDWVYSRDNREYSASIG